MAAGPVRPNELLEALVTSRSEPNERTGMAQTRRRFETDPIESKGAEWVSRDVSIEREARP